MTEKKRKHIYGRTGREKRKTGRCLMITFVMICIMGMCLTGCSKIPDVKKAETEKGEIEKIETENPDGEEGIPKENPVKDDSGKQGNAGKKEAAESEKGSKEGEIAGLGQSGQDQKGGEIELSGDIQKIGKGQFAVREITVTKDEAGGEEAAVMVVGSPGEDDADLITVLYNEETVFTKQTIWDMGARYKEKESSEAELEKDRTVHMKGYYEGKQFHAEQIQIIEVVM